MFISPLKIIVWIFYKKGLKTALDTISTFNPLISGIAYIRVSIFY